RMRHSGGSPSYTKCSFLYERSRCMNRVGLILLAIASFQIAIDQAPNWQTKLRNDADWSAPVGKSDACPPSGYPLQQRAERLPPVLHADSNRVRPQGLQGFKEKTDLVTLSVAVTDKSGAFVPGLKPQDFEVFENGVKQDIAFFSDEDIPLDIGLLLDTSG